MKGLRSLTLAMLIVSSPLVAQEIPADAPAPLGLRWGMTEAEAEATGAKLGPVEDSGVGKQYSATNLPRVLSDTRLVYLFFGFDHRLWRVGILSNSWENDKYGAAAVARFNELSGLLSERYGEGVTSIFAPTDDYYASPERFAYSIAVKERFHSETWSAQSVFIELSIGAQADDTYYLLIYEFAPLAEKVRAAAKNRDAGAL